MYQQTQDTGDLVSLSPHPSLLRGASWHLTHLGDSQEAIFPLLLLSAAHGKFTGLGARTWREVSREGPWLPRATADVPWVLGSCFSRDPCLLTTRGLSCVKPTPCLFSSPPKWSPCLANFYFVAYLEAVKTDPGGPSAVIVPYLIIFPEPDY